VKNGRNEDEVLGDAIRGMEAIAEKIASGELNFSGAARKAADKSGEKTKRNENSLGKRTIEALKDPSITEAVADWRYRQPNRYRGIEGETLRFAEAIGEPETAAMSTEKNSFAGFDEVRKKLQEAGGGQACVVLTKYGERSYFDLYVPVRETYGFNVHIRQKNHSVYGLPEGLLPDVLGSIREDPEGFLTRAWCEVFQEGKDWIKEHPGGKAPIEIRETVVVFYEGKRYDIPCRNEMMAGCAEEKTQADRTIEALYDEAIGFVESKKPNQREDFGIIGRHLGKKASEALRTEFERPGDRTHSGYMETAAGVAGKISMYSDVGNTGKAYVILRRQGIFTYFGLMCMTNSRDAFGRDTALWLGMGVPDRLQGQIHKSIKEEGSEFLNKLYGKLFPDLAALNLRLDIRGSVVVFNEGQRFDFPCR